MLKIFLALLITIEVLLIPIIIFAFSGTSIFLPGLGLVIAGSVIGVLLLMVEAVLLAVTLILLRSLPDNLSKLP